MRKFSFIALSLMMVSSCGKIKDSVDKMSFKSLTPEPVSNYTTGGQGPYTPGSYFKVVTDVGNAKDTRVYEFQYLTGGKFIYTQTSFPGGNLASSTFHKKTGTFQETNGVISHQTTYDSCTDLSPNITSVSGDKKSVVTVVWKGNTLNLYSYATWSLPAEISIKIPDATEDVGCQVFKD